MELLNKHHLSESRNLFSLAKTMAGAKQELGSALPCSTQQHLGPGISQLAMVKILDVVESSRLD
jgi:hypothetical protein